MNTTFRARVLVAEDEEFTLNLLREVLEGANFQVEAVKNVADAIEKIDTFDPTCSDNRFKLWCLRSQWRRFTSIY